MFISGVDILVFKYTKCTWWQHDEQSSTYDTKLNGKSSVKKQRWFEVQHCIINSATPLHFYQTDN